MSNQYIDTLVKFVKENDDWKTKLKSSPYNLKTLKECSWHSGWHMFVYNLFDSLLTDPVVRGCRGTVLEINGKDVKVISAPYTKFFGKDDPSGKDIEDKIVWENASIQMKIDGIICKTAKIGEKLYFFTNGSFDLNAPLSENIVNEVGTEDAEYLGDLLAFALKKEASDINVNFDRETGEFYITGGWSNNIPEYSTLMFELTSPRNKIICEYSETKLWWHGYRDPSLMEFNPRVLDLGIPYEIPRLFDANTIEDVNAILANFKGEENEGVVVVDYSTEDTPRTKIKCEDYLRLKFIRDKSTKESVLFNAVMMNEYDDLVSAVPELLPKVEEIKSNIQKLYDWCDKERIKAKEFTDRYEWVKAFPKSDLFRFHMACFEENYKIKVEKYLQFLSARKKGYKIFLKTLEKIT